MFEKIGGFKNINKLGFREPWPFVGVGVKVKLGMKFFHFVRLHGTRSGYEILGLVGGGAKGGVLIEPH